MITQDVKGNIGFDFDVNIEVNDGDEKYKPQVIREMLKVAFDRVVPQYGYSPTEQSTRVLTIKFKDTAHSRIVHGYLSLPDKQIFVEAKCREPYGHKAEQTIKQNYRDVYMYLREKMPTNFSCTMEDIPKKRNCTKEKYACCFLL